MVKPEPASTLKEEEATYTVHFEQVDITLSKEAALNLLATLAEALDEKKEQAQGPAPSKQC